MARRVLPLRPRAHYEALHAARQCQSSVEGKQLYQRRAGIEGTMLVNPQMDAILTQVAAIARRQDEVYPTLIIEPNWVFWHNTAEKLGQGLDNITGLQACV